MSEIATIGYEKATLSEVLSALKSEDIRLLIDIREAPVSRRAGFSKRVLAASLDEAGIAYIHMRALGTPKAGRDAARRGDEDTFHRIYAAHFAGAAAQEALGEVTALARKTRSCLLCYEQEPAHCHRSVVAGAMARAGFTVKHLRAGFASLL